ncbi:TonB protein [Thioalkalivibrio nitratireducens DSM 14787]|uniref:TonB protein n=1 Tax=Thioalkalivibrio nitratireducens (strain DSM 14787 / UNIQEM 213 / ALEN2) TaxID=1255043 RepID=L0DSN1_THIND|nr:TonB protein [Thioalkalivibrio nitratireducens DSM 14787]
MPDESSRLTLPLFLALVLHALVILGVGFEMLPEETPAQVTLDVTWVDAPAPAPEHAEHLAPQAQDASGAADQERMARTPEPVGERPADPAPAGDSGLIPEPIETQLEPFDPAPERPPDPVVTRAPEVPPAPAPEEPSPTDTSQAPEQPSAALLMARGLEAARAMPAETEQTLLSRATRTRYLDTLAARGAPEAAYLEAWIRKVERIGNLNYPDEARRRGLSGTLVLSVRLDAGGQVLDVAVAQSSGESILDQAAIRIVELAQPFAPFTESMRESYDQLVITRTWAFRRDRVERVR